MRITSLTFAFVVLLSAQSLFAQECQDCCVYCEPTIKFWDDVVYLLRPPSDRDPYEERIETERHDFTQSTKTVGRGVAQVEAGYTYAYKDKHEEIEQVHGTPEVMLRVGLSDDIEFRIRWSHVWKFIDVHDDVIGAQDLQMSVKLGVTDQCCLTPESAAVIRFTAPVGSEEFTTGQTEFGLDYIYSWELPNEWELYGSTGFGTNGLGEFTFLPEEPASDRYIIWFQTVALGIELSEQNTMYVEYYGVFSHGAKDEFSVNIFNIGIDHYVTENLVFDVRVGMGLTEDSDDFFSGVGGGYRF